MKLSTIIRKDDEKREEEKKEQARNISIQEGSAYSVMDGFGFRYVTPYALALGANNTHIGILNTLPYLLGSFSELFSVDAMNRMPRKRIVIASALVQASLWFAMIAIGLLYFFFGIDGNIAPTLLIIVYSLLIAAGMFLTPAWTSWMRDILPERYNTYMGLRNRIMGFVVVICTVTGGFLLDYFTGTKVFYGFIILFSIAFIGRLTSAMNFLRQYEPQNEELPRRKDGFMHFLKTIWKTNYGHFTAFVSIMSFAVYMAAPFFAVYMLKNLGFTKTQFGIVTITSAVGIMLFMPAWGRFADAYGNKKTMKITAYMIPFVPLLWFLTRFMSSGAIFPFLVVVELFDGFAWAGFNLAMGDYVYTAVKREKVASKTAHFQLVANFCAFIGGVIGGFIATTATAVMGLDILLVIMLISGILRLATARLLVNKVKEVQHVLPFGLHEAKDKLMHLTPMAIVRIVK